MPTRMRLTDIDLLAAISAPQYQEFFAKFKEKKYLKKELITWPDDKRNTIFIVKEGRVRVYLAFEEKEFTLSILEAGDIYSSHTRAFTQAMDDCTLLVTDTQSFGKIIAKFPAFGLTIVKVLGDLLKNSITIINGLVFKDINLRLAEFFIQAIEDKGEEIPNGYRLELGLTTEEIAMVVGATRQTVSVLLNDWCKSGLMKREGRKTIIIKNLTKLKQLAEYQD